MFTNSHVLVSKRSACDHCRLRKVRCERANARSSPSAERFQGAESCRSCQSTGLHCTITIGSGNEEPICDQTPAVPPLSSSCWLPDESAVSFYDKHYLTGTVGLEEPRWSDIDSSKRILKSNGSYNINFTDPPNTCGTSTIDLEIEESRKHSHLQDRSSAHPITGHSLDTRCHMRLCDLSHKLSCYLAVVSEKNTKNVEPLQYDTSGHGDHLSLLGDVIRLTLGLQSSLVQLDSCCTRPRPITLLTGLMCYQQLVDLFRFLLNLSPQYWTGDLQLAGVTVYMGSSQKHSIISSVIESLLESIENLLGLPPDYRVSMPSARDTEHVNEWAGMGLLPKWNASDYLNMFFKSEEESELGLQSLMILRAILGKMHQ